MENAWAQFVNFNIVLGGQGGLPPCIMCVQEMFSTMADMMIHVGDIMSTVGGYYHLLYENLHGTEHPTVRMISPHMYHDVPHGTQITKDDIPHSTEQSPRCSRPPPPNRTSPLVVKISPHIIMISPTVLHERLRCGSRFY